MKNYSQRFLIGIAVLVAFWLIWSRLRIHVWVNLSGWQLMVLFAVLVLGIFLVLEHLISRAR